ERPADPVPPVSEATFTPMAAAPVIHQAVRAAVPENEAVATNGGTGRAPAVIEDIAGMVGQIATSGLNLNQIGAWAQQVPAGPLQQPVQDVLAFVRDATEMAGARRDSGDAVIDTLIAQAREVFGAPREGGQDPAQALRELVEPVLASATSNDWSPVLAQIAPALRDIASGADIKTVVTDRLTPLLQSGPLAEVVRPVIMH
ncbi:hypothetical protein ACW9HQ_47325, partial [Nocardia gipuzkoensis]